MRVLLDEQLPRQLAREISHHHVRTVQQQGWAGLGNGELLRRAAEDGFDIVVTADQNLAFQQNLSGSPLAVIVLGARSNAIEDLRRLIPSLLAALTDAQPGKTYDGSPGQDTSCKGCLTVPGRFPCGYNPF